MSRRSALAGARSAIGTKSPNARSARVARNPELLEHRYMLDGTVLINEIYIDPPAGGDLLYEYIELRGTPNLPLDGYYFIALENENNAANTGATGSLDVVYNLAGKSLGSNGFLVLTKESNEYVVDPQANQYDHPNLLENSGATYMIIKNVDGTAPVQGEDLDVGNDGLDVPTGKAGWEIADSIGIFSESGEAAFGRLYGKINFGPEETTNVEPDAVYLAVNFEIEYIARWGNSTGSAADDWDVSNLTDNPDSGFTDTYDFRQSGEPHGVGAPDQIVETSHGVPYGTNLTNTLGAPNYPLNVAPEFSSTVVARQIFYNQSKFDGNNAQGNVSDDAAIATDKAVYVPGSGTATFTNFSSYTRGINGIMIDVAGTHGVFSASDFIFKVGNNNTPSTWAAGPAPTSIIVRAGAGLSGSDRVELIWGANAAKNTWLEVIVKGNDATGGNNTNTGLATSNVFFFGSRVGDSGSGTTVSAVTNLTDDQAARNNTGAGASVTNLYDYDRNGSVLLADSQAARNNTGTTLKISLTNPPAAPEVAPLAATGQEDAIAVALSLLAKAPAFKIPSWIVDRLESVDLNSGKIAQVFTQLAESGTPRAKSLLVAANKVTDKLGLDDWLLESLLDELGL